MNSIAVLFGRLLIISLTLFIQCLNSKVNSKELICYGNFEIKNNSDQFRRIANCTRIVGHLHIVLFDRDVNTRKQMESISLPNLEEITDYLLIYRIKYVVTLDWFPNLMSIRGNRTFEGNALIIQDLANLRRVDFHSLKHVRGGVRLEQVNKLCFAHTSDYRILAEAIKKNSIKYEESLQLLPGFEFSVRKCTAHICSLQVKWDYTPVIKNKTIDYFTLDLIEHEDLELFYKNIEKNNCPLESTDIIVRQNVNEYDRCEMDFEMNLDHHPLVVDQSLEPKKSQEDYQTIGFLPFNVELSRIPISVKNQYFVYSSVEQVLDEGYILGKVIDTAYNSNQKSSDESDKNRIPPKVQKRTPFDPKIYQIYGLYRFKSSGNNTFYSWNSAIKHFRNYYMVVRGCTLDEDNNPSCGVVAHNKLKTPPLESADDIDEQSVKYEVNQTSVVIHWSEPFKPNGAIVSYQIHLQESLNKTNKKTFCINREHFRAMNHYFPINGLSEETQYSFRLRATSMNGPSKKWTKEFTFNTTICITDDRSPIIYMTVGLTSLLVAFLFTATICYLKAPKRHNSQLDIISVNPEYERYTVDPEWEVKKADIQLFHMLGDGAFGRVYYGELKSGNKIIKCAVKTLMPNPRSPQRENFLKEANIMKSFVDCHHIVKFIGIVSIENPVLVLMEYMVNGDLKTYLRSNRADNDENPNPRVPTWNRIFQMAIEIADGMAYLSAHKFVHRDLAARNCMVAEDLTVKIGDFGMTRDVYDNDYYRKRDSCLIPVRWMSPESLKDGVFTTYSDIWAFGVVLWEMVTMGAQPYQGYSNESVFQNVIRGVRLTEPDNCPKKLWRIMQFCWRKNPRTRPSFNEITEYLLPSANQSFREICYYLNRKPFDKKQQSLKNILYGLIPTHKILLNDVKQKQNEFESDNGQTYCQMEPQIQRKLILSANEYTENEIEVLNKKNEINAKNVDQMTNSLIICEKQMTDQIIPQKVNEC